LSGLPPEVADLAATVFGTRLGLAEQYAKLLVTTGIDWGLIGPREAAIIWPRHLLNSAGLAQFVGPDEVVADIGSGAGLPGIPLALARPDLTVELVEPMQRRADFLSVAVTELGIAGRVRVVRSRAEDYRARPDVVVCRALASVSALVSVVAQLVPPARLLALKGQRAEAEVEAAGEALRQAGLVAVVEPVTVASEVVGRVVRLEPRYA